LSAFTIFVNQGRVKFLSPHSKFIVEGQAPLWLKIRWSSALSPPSTLVSIRKKTLQLILTYLASLWLFGWRADTFVPYQKGPNDVNIKRFIWLFSSMRAFDTS
jgi:hypothetical protein